MRMLRNKGGFSLIELMIVVAIIGVLAAIAIPNFVRFQIKSRQSEARADLSAIYTAQQAFKQEWQQYYGDFMEIGYYPNGNFRYDHGFSAAGPNSPVNYTGAIGPNAAAVNFSAGIRCGVTPATVNYGPANEYGCSVDSAPQAGAIIALGGEAVLTTNVFVASASGNIDSDAAGDYWQIDQTKTFAGPCSAAAAFPCAVNGGDLDN